MSLRRDVHSAFDQIAPSMGGLPERVVQTVLSKGATRRRKRRMLFRVRAPLSLVAVFLFIALVAVALIGGRLIHDWSVFEKGIPAGQSYADQVAQLEATPLHIAIPKSYAECTTGPLNSKGDLGSGPVFGAGGWISTTGWGSYYHNYAYTDSNVTGPILVRALDLFMSQRVIFVGRYAAGTVVGSDTVDNKLQQQRSEAVFDTSTAIKGPHGHPYEWDFIAGVPNNWSGSTGWQIDGRGFSETFLACRTSF